MAEYLRKTYKEIEKEIDSVVFIPLGAIQAHGTALPVGTDLFIPEAICRKCAESDGISFPPFFISFVEDKYNLPGTIKFSNDLSKEVIYQLLLSLSLNGFKKFVLVNGHDENVRPINFAAERIRSEFKEVKVISFNWWDVAWNEIAPLLDSKYEELGVAGEDETSIIQYLNLLRGKVPENNLPSLEGYKKYGKNPEKIEVFGKPESASPEKGKKIFDAICKKVGELVNREF